MQVSVFFGRFPFGGVDHPDTTDWLLQTFLKARADPRISHVLHSRLDDTPITMSRNSMVQRARQVKADYLVMIDSDMSPDLPYPGSKPFWDTSLDFLLQHHGPAIIAAPYCGPPPLENLYVFQWANWQTDHPNKDRRLEQYTREQAATLGGIQRAGAVPTGLILIDMRVFERMEPPYFYYEYTDQTHSKKASTEDVTFSRDAGLCGIPLYCNWDAWAGHWKKKRVGKPVLTTVDEVRKDFHAAFERNFQSNERLVILGEGRNGEQEIALGGNPLADRVVEAQ